MSDFLIKNPKFSGTGNGTLTLGNAVVLNFDTGDGFGGGVGGVPSLTGVANTAALSSVNISAYAVGDNVTFVDSNGDLWEFAVRDNGALPSGEANRVIIPTVHDGSKFWTFQSIRGLSDGDSSNLNIDYGGGTVYAQNFVGQVTSSGLRVDISGTTVTGTGVGTAFSSPGSVMFLNGYPYVVDSVTNANALELTSDAGTLSDVEPHAPINAADTVWQVSDEFNDPILQLQSGGGLNIKADIINVTNDDALSTQVINLAMQTLNIGRLGDTAGTVINSDGTWTHAGTISASNLSGTNTGDQTTISGNAATATALQNARTINGTSFNGTANITVTAAAGTLTGTTLASNVVTSSLTSVGTLVAGAVPTTLLTGTITNAQLAGSIAGSKLVGTDITSLANLVTVGTLTGGATGAGFTVALSTSTITGTLAAARLPSSGVHSGDATGTFPTVTLNAAQTGITSVGTLTGGATGAGFTIALTTSTVTGTLSAARGGTGVSNTGTITLAGNLVTTGAFNTTFAQAATTTITLPSTSATMARTDAGQTFTGTQIITTIDGLTTVTGTGALSVTGGAGNSTFVAGTGNSRTMTFQTTTSGGTATTALILNADQSATFITGTKAIPSIKVANSSTSGFFSRGAGSFSFSSAGNDIWEVGSTSMGLSSAIVLGWSSGFPDVAGADISFYRSAANEISLSVGTASGSSGNLKANNITAGGTLAVTGASTLTGGIVGTTAGGSATAGNVGEIISSAIAQGSAVSLTTATPKTVTSITLTAGDWDITGIGCSTGASTGTVFDVGITTTTDSFTGSTLGDSRFQTPTVSLTGADASLMVPAVRKTISGSTTYYLVVSETFTIGTPAAYGRISARRVR